MELGLGKRAVRAAGVFVAPTMTGGALLRGAAAQVPKLVAPTTTQRVVQAAATKPSTELTGAVAAGADSEVGAEVGREIGEAVGGAEGRATGEQFGRLVGGVVAPIGVALVAESGKMLVTKGAKKLLSESAPTIEGLKQAARKVYNELDNLGVTVNPGGVARLSTQLSTLARKEGFNATIHPKVNAALKEFKSVEGRAQSLSELDVLRRVSQAAANSADPDEKRLGTLLIQRIDDFLDNIGSAEISKGAKNATEVGAKYRAAR